MKKIIYILIVAALFSAFFAFSGARAEEIDSTGFMQGMADTVTFSWENDPEASFYYIYKYNPKTEKYELYSATEKNKITADGLRSGKTYYFKVMAVKIEAGRKIPVSVSEKITCVTAPEGRLNVKTADIGKNYISLKWNKVEGATGYKIFVYDSEKGEYTPYKSTKERKITVKKLKKNKEYKFLIQAYKRKNGAVAYGTKSDVYSEFTDTDGVPHSSSQVAKAYNTLVNTVKQGNNMTVKYTKEIDTEVIFCSKENLTLTVKNIANLYEGVLNKKYTFVAGKSGNVTPDSLFEPYGKKAAVERDDIDTFTVKETKSGYEVTFTVKKDNGSRKNGTYYDGLLSLKNPTALDTTPLKIRSADTYYDSARVSFTVKDKKLKTLTVQGSVLSDINFEVAKRVADTTVGYALYEKYGITY